MHHSALQTKSGFIFDHIPKTAGTTLRALFEDILGADQVSPPVTGKSELWAVQKFSRFRMITGHFIPYPLDERVRQRALLTFLRHPIDRAVSGYFYLRNHVDEALGGARARLAKNHNLHDYLRIAEDTGDSYLSNYVACHLSSKVSRQASHDVEILDNAKKLLSSYDFVGIYEQLEDSVEVLCQSFGWPAAVDLKQLNRTEDRQAVAEIDQRTMDKLIEMNQLDLALYDHGRALYEEKKARPAARWRRLPTRPARPAPLPQRKREEFGDRAVEIRGATLRGRQSGCDRVKSGEDVAITIQVASQIDVSALTVGIEICDQFGEVAFGTNTHLMGCSVPVAAGGTYDVSLGFPARLNLGRYTVTVALHEGPTHTDRCFHWRDQVTSFEVVSYGGAHFAGYACLDLKFGCATAAPPRRTLLDRILQR